MKYSIKKWDEYISVPREPTLKNLREADAVQLRVLMYIMSTPGYTNDELCDYLDITKKRLTLALQFWEKAGVLEKPRSETKKEAKPSTKAVSRAAELPKYTSDEITNYIEHHKGTKQLLIDCQQLIGKMFNMAETEIVIGMLDYLKLDEAYISLLFAHCAKNGKKSLRYIEKMAIGLFDDGIIGYEELDVHLCQLEAAASADKPLRKLFGVGARALTKKEQDAFSRWCGEWQLSFEMIERAYEVTVENTGSASIPYCNAVLERWHESGYKTLDEVEAAISEYKHDKVGVKDQKGSFETDDFFEAALKRSYGGVAK